MSLDPQVVGAMQAVVGTVSLAFLYPAVVNRDRRGSRGFAAFVLAISLWSFGLVAGNLTGDHALSVGAYRVVLLAAELAAASWLVLAIEVTGRGGVTRSLLAGLAGWVGTMQLLVWTNPAHHLVLDPRTAVEGVILVPVYAVGFWIHAAGSYLLVGVGIGLFAVETVRSTGLRREQSLLLTLAAVPLIATNIATVFDLLYAPHDLTPFGFLLTAVVFAVVLFRGQFLDVVSVARRTAMAEMSEAVVTLDARDRVVDCNERARRVFDIGDDYVGTAAATFFDPVPAERILDGAPREPDRGPAPDGETDGGSEVTVPTPRGRRHLSVSASPVGEGATRGRVVVLHDVTAQKRRERQLRRQNERLDRFAGVVSHDLRTPMQVAHGNLSIVEETGELDRVEDVRAALERMETIVDDLLRLARVDALADARPVRLDEAVREAWENCLTDGVVLDSRVPDGATIMADRDCLLHVFENLFRNAIDHNDDDAPLRVAVDTLDARADGGDGSIDGFVVEDDGDGLPESATGRDALFEYGYTTSDDGTGLGLSIVQDVVEAHGWEITARDAPDGGARFEITGVDTRR